jgi:hypothetical protein
MDGSTDMEGNADGVIEGTMEGNIEGLEEGTRLVEGATEGLVDEAEPLETMDVTAVQTSSLFLILPFCFLDLVAVDKKPLAPTVTTNCGQRQMFTSTLVPFKETVSPGAMMMLSFISSLVTASGHNGSDIPTVATSTLALKELKCWMIVAS